MHPLDGLTPEQYIFQLSRVRRLKDEFFATAPESPMPDDLQGDAFSGLRYYAPDLAYRVEADLVPFDTPEVVMLGTTQGDIRPQLRFGELRFTLIGQDARLLAFKDANASTAEELFVPFRDATSGGETYGAGRYVEVEDPGSPDGPHKVVVDFNLAYNPWCAYNIAYSCTLPPPENTLALPIMAGELLFPHEH
jgi:uncharacterized protein